MQNIFSLRQNRTILERPGRNQWRDVTGRRDELDQLPDAIRLSRAGITEQNIRPLWDAPDCVFSYYCY